MVSLILGAVAVVVTVSTGSGSDVGLLAWLVSASVLGLILVVRVGALRMGGLMLIIGLAGAVAALGASIPSDPEYLALLPITLLSGVAWITFIGLTIAGLPLLFPTGRPPTPRWRPVLGALIFLLALGAAMEVFSPQLEILCSDGDANAAECAAWEASDQLIAIDGCEEIELSGGAGRECVVVLPNPVGIAWVPELEGSTPGDAVFAGFLVVALLSVISLGVRLRRAGAEERQQIKFLFVSLGAMFTWFLVEDDVVGLPPISDPIYSIIEFLVWTAIPVSIFLAITRYRLYEIDRIISRTVSYSLVVGVLAVVFSTGVVWIPSALGLRDTPVMVAGSTLAVAAMFNPLRRRVQRWVDRRFNRSRYDAERVIGEFAGSLRDGVDPDGVVDGWVGVVSETMQPSSIGVWVRS